MTFSFFSKSCLKLFLEVNKSHENRISVRSMSATVREQKQETSTQKIHLDDDYLHLCAKNWGLRTRVATSEWMGCLTCPVQYSVRQSVSDIHDVCNSHCTLCLECLRLCLVATVYFISN